MRLYVYLRVEEAARAFVQAELLVASSCIQATALGIGQEPQYTQAGDTRQVVVEGSLVDTSPLVLIASSPATVPGPLYIIRQVVQVAASLEAYHATAPLEEAFLAFALLAEAFLEVVPTVACLSSASVVAVGLKVASSILDLLVPLEVSIPFVVLLQYLSDSWSMALGLSKDWAVPAAWIVARLDAKAVLKDCLSEGRGIEEQVQRLVVEQSLAQGPQEFPQVAYQIQEGRVVQKVFVPPNFQVIQMDQVAQAAELAPIVVVDYPSIRMDLSQQVVPNHEIVHQLVELARPAREEEARYAPC